jgi:hypothetical protein
MSVTFEQVIKGAGFWLNQGDAVGGLAGPMDSFANATAEGKYWVNDAYAFVYDEMAKGYPLGIATAFLSFVANQELYDMPEDFKTLKRIENNWDQSDVSLRIEVPLVSLETRSLFYSSIWYQPVSSDMQPGKAYLYQDRADTVFKIGFLPVPTAAQTNNIKLWYWPVPVELTNAADTLAKPLEPFQSLIALRAARSIMAKSGLDVTYLDSEWQARYKQFVSAIRSDFNQTGPQTPIYRPDTWDG